MSFKNNYFDFVFAKGIAPHWKSQKGLDEFLRLIKKDGYGYYTYMVGVEFSGILEKMRKIMKIIPYKFSINVLKLYGMPAERTIFVDTCMCQLKNMLVKDF